MAPGKLHSDPEKPEAEVASDGTAGVWCSKLSFPTHFSGRNNIPCLVNSNLLSNSTCKMLEVKRSVGPGPTPMESWKCRQEPTSWSKTGSFSKNAHGQQGTARRHFHIHHNHYFKSWDPNENFSHSRVSAQRHPLRAFTLRQYMTLHWLCHAPPPLVPRREGNWLTKWISNATLLQVRLLSAQGSLPRRPSRMLLAQQGPQITSPMAPQESLTLHITGTVQTQLNTAGKAELNHSTAVHTFCSLRTFWMKKR